VISKTLSGELAQGADRSPRTVSFSLRPQDASLIEGFKIDQNVSVAVNGRMQSMSAGDYGVSFTLEIDGAGLSIDRPEPKKFVDQMATLKILKG